MVARTAARVKAPSTRGRMVLARAQHAPLTLDEDGKPPAKRATLNALVRQGYLAEVTVDDGPAWEITPNGRKALHMERPHLLSATAPPDYTTEPALAMAGEPEAVDPRIVEEFAGRAFLKRAMDPTARGDMFRKAVRSSTKTLQNTMTAADRAGVDVTPHLKAIQEANATLEREIRTARDRPPAA